MAKMMHTPVAVVFAMEKKTQIDRVLPWKEKTHTDNAYTCGRVFPWKTRQHVQTFA
jgi:hypothetical protein